jgi:Zn-dependent M28 family amino/carboxypeptidase
MGADQNAYPDMKINEVYLKETIEALTTIRPYRNSENPGSLRKAAAYIQQRFLEYDLKTEEQEFEAEGNRYFNVIATLGPEKAERIVIGAHYDVCDEQSGADDNASGIAGLLEIARLLSVSGRNLKYRYDFVAYALEEPPFFATKQMGSYMHARSLHDAKVRVKGMICLESIGYFSEKEESQHYPLGFMKWFYPRTGNFIAVVGNLKSGPFLREVKKHMRAASIKIESLNSPAWLPGVDFSDHRNYWAFGYPAVMITDTAFYRNPNYHMPTDAPDTLDFEKMEEVIKGVAWFLLNIK